MECALSVSTLSWTLSAAVVLFAAPVSSTVSGGGTAFDSRIAAQITVSAAPSERDDRVTGSVAIHTRKLDLDVLVLSDFGDEPVLATR